MADRPLERLLPQALAIVGGVAAIAYGAGAFATETLVGRPSSTSALGLVFLLPLALLSAVLGFALGHALGVVARRAHVGAEVSMRPYRAVLALTVLATAALAGWAGALPVLRHERRHAPRVIDDTGVVNRRSGGMEECAAPTPAPVVCDIAEDLSSQTIVWNGRDLTVGCTRDGMITLSDDASGQMAAVDLTDFEYLREVRAGAVRQSDGREALAVLAEMRATGRRAMFVWIDADGRRAFQELLERTAPSEDEPLAICAGDDRAAAVVRLGAPVTYQAR